MEELANNLTVPEAAKRLGVNADTVRRYLREGKLTGTLIGGDSGGYRIPENDIARMLMGLPNGGVKIRLTLKHSKQPLEVREGDLLRRSPCPTGGTILTLQGSQRDSYLITVMETDEEIAELRRLA